MKKTISLLVVLSFLFCIASPVFSEDSAADTKLEIVKQEQISRDGADTFWTGVIVGVVSAGTLIPVSMVIGTDTDGKKTVFGIVGGSMAGVTAVLLAWGGIEWLLAEGKIGELKKTQKDVTLVPYLNPLAQNSVELGLGVNISL